MKEIISWIISIEDRARRCYEKATTCFSEDKELSRFLTRLAEGEKYHSEIIRDIAERLKHEPRPPFFISLDDETKQNIERPFVEFERDLAEGELAKKDLLEHIVAAEFSEWNDRFLCTINAAKDSPPINSPEWPRGCNSTKGA